MKIDKVIMVVMYELKARSAGHNYIAIMGTIQTLRHTHSHAQPGLDVL